MAIEQLESLTENRERDSFSDPAKFSQLQAQQVLC
jgi:hypothetical protein